MRGPSVRNSSICFAAERRSWLGLAALALCLFAVLGCASSSGGGAPAGASLIDLTNPSLGPEYSTWLGGPIARMASREEVDGYLALRDDRQAADFIERFWERRNNAAPKTLGPGPHDLFEDRAAVADRKFGEAGVLGRRTDRGTILILYGAPSKGTFETGQRPNDPPIEVWFYKDDAPVGLDGKHPDAAYRFAKRGELTVFYVPRPGRLLVAPPGDHQP